MSKYYIEKVGSLHFLYKGVLLLNNFCDFLYICCYPYNDENEKYANIAIPCASSTKEGSTLLNYLSSTKEMKLLHKAFAFQ